MLCMSADALPVGPDWVYEPKFDGFRTLVFRKGDAVRIRGRNGGALERSFPEIVRAAKELLPDDTVVDGELVVCDEDGVSFDALLDRLAGERSARSAAVMAFDVLRVRGRDVRREAFVVRRRLLEQAASMAFITVPQTTDPDIAHTWLDGFASNGVEGIVAKRRGDRYVCGQRRLIKVKRRRTIDCVVGGWRGDVDPDSLLLSLYDETGGLRYIGQTVRLSPQDRIRAKTVLEPQDESPFVGRPPGLSRWDGFRFGQAEWQPVRPTKVVEVSFTQLSYGMFRHAVRLIRWRPERDAPSCRSDQLPQR